MKTFKVEITEVLSKTVEVRAEDRLSAVEEIEREYNTGEIVLDYKDFKERKVEVLDD